MKRQPKFRPKRQYATLPKATGKNANNGWQGLGEYFALIALIAVPQGLIIWRWALSRDHVVFALLTVSYLILLVIFCVIARPWTHRGLS